MGQPHCLTCYDSTAGQSERLEPPTGPTTPAPSGQSHNGRPAPPASRRRFAPPGLVLQQSQPLKPSDSEARPNRPPLDSPSSSSSTAPVPAPLRDNRSLNSRDIGNSHLIKPKPDGCKDQLKGTQGLYRETVRNLAKRFELPGSPTPDQAGNTPRRMFHG